jgi:hypothetical protein
MDIFPRGRQMVLFRYKAQRPESSGGAFNTGGETV